MAQITVKDFVNEQTGATLDAKIANAVSALFPTTMDFPENMSQSTFLKKLLTRYMNYEFCRDEDDLDFWSLEATGYISGLLEKYNPLYESMAFEFDPLTNINTEGQNSGTMAQTQNTGVTRNGSESAVTAHDLKDDTTRRNEAQGAHGEVGQENTEKEADGENHDKKRISDTPQGGLSGLENNTYLTSAELNDGTTKADEKQSSERVITGQENSQEDGEEHKVIDDDTVVTRTTVGTDDTAQSTIGNNSGSSQMSGYSGISPSRLVNEYRDTLKKVTQEFLGECAVLFNLSWSRMVDI